MRARNRRFLTARALRSIVTLLFLPLNNASFVNASASTPSKFVNNTPKSESMDDVDFDVIICGGGIVGLSTAVGLTRQLQFDNENEKNCVRIKIYEQATSLKPVGALFGLFSNGVAALQSICPRVCQKVLDSAIQVKGSIHKDVKDGMVVAVRETTSATSSNGMFLVWYLLQRHLADALPDDVLRLGKVFESYEIDEETGLVRVTLSDRESSSNEPIVVTCRVLIGADGIKSSVRKSLVGKDVQLHYHNRIMYRGVIDKAKVDNEEGAVCSPRGYRVSYTCGEVGKGFGFGESASGIVTITATVIKGVPILDHQHQPLSSDPDEIKARMRETFKNYPPEVHRVIDQMDGSAIYENAVHDIDMLHDGWSDGSVIIIGDAAHAMTPALGQGGNIGLEDGAELALSLAPVLREIASATRDHNDANNTDTEPGNGVYRIKQQQEQIANVLNKYWQRRYPRVEEVHRISREQARERNKGISKSEFRKRNQDFYERLYGWEPGTGRAGMG